MGFNRETAGNFIKIFRSQKSPQNAKFILLRGIGEKFEATTLPEMEGEKWFIDLETTKTAMFSKKDSSISPSFDFTGVAQSWDSGWTSLLVLNFQQILKDVRLKIG
jgi:hypothetical protein